MKKDREGFTVMELMVIVAVMTVLVSAILLSAISIRENSQKGEAAYRSLKSMTGPVFTCLDGGLHLSSTSNRISVCADNGGNNFTGLAGWPDFSQYGWEANAQYCFINSTLDSHPDSCGAYNESNGCGANSSGKFCFMVKNNSASPTKWAWCTTDGCNMQ
jgi:hypothetical protein